MDAEPRSPEPDGERGPAQQEHREDHALKLADADGLDALTIRKLAQDLGVTPMALYWHFRSKEDLLEGVAERVWGEIDVTSTVRRRGRSFRALLESLVGVLRAHPSAPGYCSSTRSGTRRHCAPPRPRWASW